MSTILVIEREWHNIGQSSLRTGPDWKSMVKCPFDEKLPLDEYAFEMMHLHFHESTHTPLNLPIKFLTLSNSALISVVELSFIV